MTTKLAWNQFNKIPYDTMMWRGIDGSEVLTHLITTLGVNQPIKDFFTTYNGMLHPDAIMGGWMRYQNKDINNDILLPTLEGAYFHRHVPLARQSKCAQMPGALLESLLRLSPYE